MVEFRALFSQQNFVKKPFRVAMEDFCDLRTQIWIGLTKSVNNLAQMGFVDSDHLGKAVLPDAARIHAQLQIWVDIAINWHLFYPTSLVKNSANSQTWRRLSCSGILQ
jgi:hypothetical protein